MSDRPIECSECKKKLLVSYTEIVGVSVNKWSMCNDCPILKRRGDGEMAHVSSSKSNSSSNELKCPGCASTQESVRIGGVVGCRECYHVFEQDILQEFKTSSRIPSGFDKSLLQEKGLHLGKEPGEVRSISPSIQLIALNEALDETLSNEDYEQAAWLRDQIKQITEEQDEK
jgi:protein arginine kinase activator